MSENTHTDNSRAAMLLRLVLLCMQNGVLVAPAAEAYLEYCKRVGGHPNECSFAPFAAGYHAGREAEAKDE